MGSVSAILFKLPSVFRCERSGKTNIASSDLSSQNLVPTPPPLATSLSDVDSSFMTVEYLLSSAGNRVSCGALARSQDVVQLIPLLSSPSTRLCPPDLSHTIAPLCIYLLLSPSRPCLLHAAQHPHSPPQHLDLISFKLTCWNARAVGRVGSARLDRLSDCCRRAEGRRCVVEGRGATTWCAGDNRLLTSSSSLPQSTSPVLAPRTGSSTRITQGARPAHQPRESSV